MSRQRPSSEHTSSDSQSPHVPPQPSEPQMRRSQSGTQSQLPASQPVHSPAAVSQLPPSGQVPHWPPQPSSPQVFPSQSGVQAALAASSSISDAETSRLSGCERIGMPCTLGAAVSRAPASAAPFAGLTGGTVVGEVHPKSTKHARHGHTTKRSARVARREPHRLTISARMADTEVLQAFFRLLVNAPSQKLNRMQKGGSTLTV